MKRQHWYTFFMTKAGITEFDKLWILEYRTHACLNDPLPISLCCCCCCCCCCCYTPLQEEHVKKFLPTSFHPPPLTFKFWALGKLPRRGIVPFLEVEKSVELFFWSRLKTRSMLNRFHALGYGIPLFYISLLWFNILLLGDKESLKEDCVLLSGNKN